MAKHCWHEDGAGLSHYTGGTDYGYCCRCGKDIPRGWHLENEERPEGHGPFYRLRKTKYVRAELPEDCEADNDNPKP